MGGRVLFALSIAAFPEELPREVMTEIFAGASSKVREAGGTLAGGHTIRDPEPKYGLAVIGAAHPDRLLRKGGARPGDRLLLTKPLGTGLLVSGARQGRTTDADLATAIDGMRRLNRAASEALVASGVRTATDVTGFGLLGHGLEMARASGTRFVFEAAGLPALPGALDLAAAGVETGGAAHNRRYVAGSLDVAPNVPDEQITLAHDPQTSGGLLAAVPPDLVPPSNAPSTTPASSAGGSAGSRPVSRGSRWHPETWNGPPDDGRTGRRCVPRSVVQSTTIPNGAAPPGIANGEPPSSVSDVPSIAKALTFATPASTTYR